MSIYISGVEMPDKTTTIVIFPEGKARVFRQDIDHDEWLTAIEVPTPHGRLIEEPKQLSYDGLAYISPYDVIGTAKYFLDQIRAMPTIIEADSDAMFYPQVDGITPTVIKAEAEEET